MLNHDDTDEKTTVERPLTMRELWARDVDRYYKRRGMTDDDAYDDYRDKVRGGL
jgi:hypothetical protein